MTSDVDVNDVNDVNFSITLKLSKTPLQPYIYICHKYIYYSHIYIFCVVRKQNVTWRFPRVDPTATAVMESHKAALQNVLSHLAVVAQATTLSGYKCSHGCLYSHNNKEKHYCRGEEVDGRKLRGRNSWKLRHFYGDTAVFEYF